MQRQQTGRRLTGWSLLQYAAVTAIRVEADLISWARSSVSTFVYICTTAIQ